MDRSTPRQVRSDMDIRKKLVSRRRPDRRNRGLQEERDRTSRSDDIRWKHAGDEIRSRRVPGGSGWMRGRWTSGFSLIAGDAGFLAGTRFCRRGHEKVSQDRFSHTKVTVVQLSEMGSNDKSLKTLFVPHSRVCARITLGGSRFIISGKRCVLYR